MASQRITYFLWLFFGWLGIHHLYLGRVNQAFIWFATLGGGCGIGWIRDLWRIPHYVQQCNANQAYQIEYLSRVARKPRPGCSYFRLAGMFVMGFATAAVLCTIIPDYQTKYKPNSNTYFVYSLLFLAFMVIGNVIGVMLVVNNGELMCTKRFPLQGALMSLIWASSSKNIAVVTLLTCCSTWFRALQWRPFVPGENQRQRGRTKHLKNIAIYVTACTIWVSVLTYGFYFNAKITVETGEKIPVREAISNFFKSPAWRRTQESLTQLFNIYRHAGWSRVWQDARSLFDFSGEVNAYKILDLSPGVGSKEIAKKCRKLKAEFHPDRFKSEDEKDEAQNRFIEIQSACATLTRKVRAKRESEKKTSEQAKPKEESEETRPQWDEKEETHPPGDEKEEEPAGDDFDDWLYDEL